MLNAAVKRLVLSSFLNVSVEAGEVDSEKQSQSNVCYSDRIAYVNLKLNRYLESNSTFLNSFNKCFPNVFGKHLIHYKNTSESELSEISNK